MIGPMLLDNLSKKQYNKLIDRIAQQYTSTIKIVKSIVEKVKSSGDKALLKYMRKFDNVNLKSSELIMTKKEINTEFNRIIKERKNRELFRALRKAYNNIYKFHKHQKIRDNFFSSEKNLLGLILRPLNSVAIYIPSGRATYPSTLLMGAIPAKIAGVKEITIACKCSKNKEMPKGIILAAKITNIDKIVKIAGAQAISALAYGTETIPKVDKIVGPGNVYVNTAKMYLQSIGAISIDFPAGPSEVLVIADNSAVDEFVAWDMLSQLEHDVNASAILLTTSKNLANSVSRIIINEVRVGIPRYEILKESVRKNCVIIICQNIDDAIRFSNEYAPEHLQIMTQKSNMVLQKITNAGSIFIGNYSPVVAGDYFTGTNHILPTGGAAKYYSGISVETFHKKNSFQLVNKKYLKKYAVIINKLAEYEGFNAHSISVRKRI